MPGRDLEEDPKKEKTFWVAEADFGIMVAAGDYVVRVKDRLRRQRRGR